MNANQAVQRARKLEIYINKNVKLGLSEKKDKLQVRAQLHSKLAELSAIQLQWKQQQTSLNRLMLEDWQQNFKPILFLLENNKYSDLHGLIKMTESSHPAVTISHAQLQIAESQIMSWHRHK